MAGLGKARACAAERLDPVKEHVPVSLLVPMKALHKASVCERNAGAAASYKGWADLTQADKQGLARAVTEAMRAADPQARDASQRLTAVATERLRKPKAFKMHHQGRKTRHPQELRHRNKIADLVRNVTELKACLSQSPSPPRHKELRKQMQAAEEEVHGERAALKEHLKKRDEQQLHTQRKRVWHMAENDQKQLYRLAAGEFADQPRVRSVQDAQGDVISEPKHVHAHIVQQWTEHIFNANTTKRTPEFDNEFLSLLQPIKDLAWLQDPFTTEEVRATLDILKKDTSTAGGLPVNVFAEGGEILTAELVQLLNRLQATEGGLCGLSDAVISLIPKGGVLSLEALKLRPIQLTQAIYRVYVKALDLRMRRALLPHGAISDMQGAYQAGRSADDVPTTVELFTQQAERTGDQQIVACLDYRKMYDSLPRWAVVAILEKLGVPTAVVRNVAELIQARRCMFKTALGRSEPFEPVNGIGQGCPFSCLCSVLVVDLPLRKIDKLCRGSTLKPAEHRGKAPDTNIWPTKTQTVKVMGYVDDIVLLPKDVADLRSMVKILEDWCTVTGMSLAPDKSHWLVWNGNAGDTKISIAGTDKQEATKLTLLGVVFDKAASTTHTTQVLTACQSRAEGIGKLKHVGPDTKCKMLRAVVCGKLSYAPLLLKCDGGYGLREAIDNAQKTVDGVVRRSAQCEHLLTEQLRLPPSMGGFDAPDIVTEVRALKLASMQRLLNGTTVASHCL
eukprot:gene7397-637_t